MLLLASSHSGQLSIILIIGLIILGLGLILRRIKQPYVIAYILAGIFLGEHGFAIITDETQIAALGEFGLILLLFFIGMETDLGGLVNNWKIAILGTCFQVLSSVLLVYVIGFLFNWPLQRTIVLGFVISLSSSAVVIKLLQDNNELQSPVGQNVISVLLMQDVLIVPMLIATNYLGGISPSSEELLLQLVGGLAIVGGMIWIFRQEQIVLPFSKQLEDDHELQVFLALIICFGFAALTSFFGLSAALGAFVAGLVVHAARSTSWFHDSLHSFRVIFVAVFFISVGMLIDLTFLYEHWKSIGTLLLAVYISNHFINAIILRYFGSSWSESLHGGALLAQIGELSFVLAATAFQTKIISDYGYQLSLLVISLTLLLSPFWIYLTERIVDGYKTKPEQEPT